MIFDPQLRVSNKTIATQPTTRTYIKDIPVLGYPDIVNETNQVYPFVNREEKVPIIDNHVNMVPLPRTYSVPHYFGCPCNHCRAMLAMKNTYEETKLENERAFLEIKKHQFLQKKQKLQNDVRELLDYKNKVEHLTETQKKKHKKRRKMFDEKDYNLMHQMQQSQKDLNGLIMAKKSAQTDKFLSENEALNERINLLESNQLNNQWKDHYKNIDNLHQKKTSKMESYVQSQAKQHQKWLKEYNDWYQNMIDYHKEMQRDYGNSLYQMLTNAQNGFNPMTQGNMDTGGDMSERTDYQSGPNNNLRQSQSMQGGNEMPPGYEQISPQFNPFWNPTKPMPYPVKPPPKETFPPATGKNFNFSSPQPQSNIQRNQQPYGFQQAVKQGNAKDIPAHPKYATYWRVLNEDNTLREKAYDYDERLNYFLPPLRDEGKNTNYIYPTVLSKDAILTAKGVMPR
eukprot:403341766